MARSLAARALRGFRRWISCRLRNAGTGEGFLRKGYIGPSFMPSIAPQLFTGRGTWVPGCRWRLLYRPDEIARQERSSITARQVVLRCRESADEAIARLITGAAVILEDRGTIDVFATGVAAPDAGKEVAGDTGRTRVSGAIALGVGAEIGLDMVVREQRVDTVKRGSHLSSDQLIIGERRSRHHFLKLCVRCYGCGAHWRAGCGIAQISRGIGRARNWRGRSKRTVVRTGA